MDPVRARQPAASPLDSLIPPEKRPAADAALRDAFGDAAVTNIALVTGGASGAQVFKVLAAGGEWLLRLEANRGGLHDPVRQYSCMRVAAEAGIAPRVLYANADAGVAVTAFIRSSATTSEDERRERLAALARAVAALHRTQLFPRFMDFFDAMDSLLGSFGATGVLPPSVRERLMRGYRAIADVYPRGDAELVSSHNDLNPSNVLFEDARPWLIDWELAFAADRYLDIGALQNFFTTEPSDEEIVLRGYFGETLNDTHRARAYLMQQVNRIYYSALLLQLAAMADPAFRLAESDLGTRSFQEIRASIPPVSGADGRIRFATVFLRDALAGMESARCAESIAIVRG